MIQGHKALQRSLGGGMAPLRMFSRRSKHYAKMQDHEV